MFFMKLVKLYFILPYLVLVGLLVSLAWMRVVDFVKTRLSKRAKEILKVCGTLLVASICSGGVGAYDSYDSDVDRPSRRWVEQENRDVTRDLILWHLLRQRNHADRLERLERYKLDRPIRRW